MAPSAAATLRDLAVAQVDATATLVRTQTAEIDPDDAAAHAMLNDARAQVEVAQAALKALAEALPVAGEEEAAWRDRLRHEVLDVWIKAHLDVTFVAESAIANGQRSITPEELDQLVTLVRAPVDLAVQWSGNGSGAAGLEPAEMGAQLAALFDAEVAETVLWRLGALHFMYASSRCNMEQANAVPDCPPQVFWYGMRLLRAMLTTRPDFQYPAPDASVAEDAEAPSMVTPLSAKDADPGHLVTDGVYGTVTVLAMMYTIELLGWLHCALGANPAAATELGVSRATVRYIALALLQRYFSLLRTTLAGMGWMYDRALAVWRQMDPAGFARDGATVTKSLAEASRRKPFFANGP